MDSDLGDAGGFLPVLHHFAKVLETARIFVFTDGEFSRHQWPHITSSEVTFLERNPVCRQ